MTLSITSNVSSAGRLTIPHKLELTNWGSNPTAADFVVYNGIGGMDGAVLAFSNPSSGNATVRSFSIQGFVRTP
ncbi:MAG: hypothetical protein CVU38_15260 [Chloroflexi bacterium HGW-Chloroflexi-1]|nr:MAG: hypothetical protein CVU38_15260 [Chloroflexi bacterium HGW-Chloroflexi-1]